MAIWKSCKHEPPGQYEIVLAVEYSRSIPALFLAFIDHNGIWLTADGYAIIAPRYWIEVPTPPQE